MTTAQTPAPPQRLAHTSHAGRNAGILIVLLLFFFVVPIFPYTFASGSLLGVNVQSTGDISLSYMLFHCGMVVNLQASGSFLGYSVANYNEGSPGFVCNGSG
ncbi:MAG: hypothetical protein JRN14_03225 [Nitrososphaerota archaeon]|nr:hypothetical protein [Nitrososphaerota archaeon]